MSTNAVADFVVKGHVPPSGGSVGPRLPLASGIVFRGGQTPPLGGEVSAQFSGGYSPPSGGAVEAVLPLGSGVVTRGEYVAPSGDTVTASFAPWKPYDIPSPPLTITLPPSGRVFGDAFGAVPLLGGITARHGVRAVASGAVPLAGGALAETENTAAIGNAAGAVPLAGAATVRHGVRATADGHLPITLSGSATVRHGARAVLSGGVPLAGGAMARHGVRGVAAGGVSLGGSVASTHIRYEVRGEVRLTEGGLLVQRRVRVYSRETGALVGQGDSVGGYFQVPCDLAPAEYVILPIDLSESATDFAPPVANRVTSVLARDDWR